MASLNTKNFSTLVQQQALAIQSKTRALIDFTSGSILRATVEAVAAVTLWLQGLILQVLTLTRASTSSSTDLDSWVQDYGVTRLGAASASGYVTFSRLTNTVAAVIPVGAKVQTFDAAQSYSVVADVLNASYSANVSGYLVPVGVSSLTVPVKADIPSAASNVVAGAIGVMSSSISGVDIVSNTLPISGGTDAETDAALRLRFITYIQSLSRATKSAIGYAVTSMQLGLSYAILENVNLDGSPNLGFFCLIIDDGSGAPTTTLQQQVYGAVDLVRPVGCRFAVFPPTIVTVSVSCQLTMAQGYAYADVIAAVGTALSGYVNTLDIGEALRYTRLAQIAYDASPGVLNVSALLLNGATADVTPAAYQIIKTSGAAVS